MSRHIFIFITIILSSSALSAQLVETIAKIKPSVVGIGVYTPTGKPRNTLQGSGFVIGNGQYVITNHHVVSEKLDESLLQELVVFIGSGKNALVRKASLVDSSKRYDLAILKIEGKPLPAMILADKKLYPEGSYVAFTGFPIGAILGIYPATHRGYVSAITPDAIPAMNSQQLNLKMMERLDSVSLIYQLDAIAYPGNSGSPMYDPKSGEVVGVINKVLVKDTKESALSSPTGISYAIPVKYVHNLISDAK